MVVPLVVAALMLPAVSDGGSAVAAVPTGGPATVALAGSASPALPSAARLLGAVAAGRTIRIEVALKVPDPARLTAFIAGLSDRQSPLFGRFLGPGQFAARFGPPPGEITAVDAWLRSDGLTVGAVAADHLSVSASAPASVIESAFATRLVAYDIGGGRGAYTNSRAPRVPAQVAPYVQGVLGLSTLYEPQSQIATDRAAEGTHGGVGRSETSVERPTTAGPQACSDASDIAEGYGAFTATELASHYAMTPLYGLGDDGAGVRVALVELEPVLASDVTTYQQCYGSTATVNYVDVDGGPGIGAGTGESALDIEDLVGLAPDVTVDVYQGPAPDFVDVYSQIVNDDTDPVVSTSWGLCQLDADPATLDFESNLFAQAAAQGQSVLASGGDYGSTDCYDTSGANQDAVSVSDPAGQPYVVGVGGTSLGPTSESVWNDSAGQDGAGGGGVSAIDGTTASCMPAYQDQPKLEGVISPDSQASSSCPVGYEREVPDVSADADPNTGYVIFFTGTSQGLFYGWGPVGGTSAAAPLWAAVAALIDSSPFCSDGGSGDPGVRPQGLYQIAASTYGYAFSDVSAGNNDYTPSGYQGGLYSATDSYDMASGIGLPLVTSAGKAANSSLYYPGLAALMCRYYATKPVTAAITGLSRHAGPANHAETITVTGSGFLAIPGTDELGVGSKLVPASCASATSCEVTLPKMPAGRVDLRMHVEDLTVSPVVSAAEYTFVGAPSITSLSPPSGPTRGRNRVTLHGTQLSGATIVRFGSKRATIRWVEATRIRVVAPVGIGTVHVVVTTAEGGPSASGSTSRYRYVR